MPNMQPAVLVVDDEVHSLDAIRRTLEETFPILTASSADRAKEILDQRSVSVVLCDQRMPDLTGVEFLKQVRERWPHIVRIIISGYTDLEDVIAGINDAGIYCYIQKPWAPDHLLATIRQAVDTQGLRGDLQRLDLELRSSPSVLLQRRSEKMARVRDEFSFERIVRAPGSPVDPVCEVAARVARYDLPVLVQGESGTGKELLARAIHYASPRADQAFVVENLASIADPLIESELFGHKRGAFTGAYEDHIGLFQRADGGTVFLDEIGDTSPALQVKLLRVLQEGEVRPVGSTRTLQVDVRLIAATHRDLETAVREGRFREDLYYRLAGITLAMPPLRERPGDLPAIAARLLEQAARDLGREALTFSADALSTLVTYPWPGNIRELRNEIYRAVVLSEDDCIRSTAFSRKVQYGQVGQTVPGMNHGIPATGTLQERLDAIEAVVLKEALLRHRWNKTRAAQELGLSRVGLRQKLLRFRLEEK
ncbi:Hydrogenase transcriptional regulatory protein hupR1 [Paraburkholderia phenoliruptrix]|uniref:Hydrogenase transcriptional regulatory protein hupR1 n=1 Tax=Paraburkholderia phenoliruptrix TaxID=252970 RepID=A0A6J5CLD6_9BURK|nr:sigma-54 dependent transcriptional regulator [Paraburkholderia phenoliruptrix]CAB3738487.1 Hydrogenase transcriptional regulatory protein hupR1 [Paraburkholderia phenoliruptrix]